ncbi:FG-GAP-like repeat-containing protein [Winogradskyella alexanderae]|uniref:FG-GAP-like repeat-containing protein n=1 Tax=Winogradskyella alexanderae TaxID=2877123 RepID=A0ABS7XQT4_9FLAO|nr:FG-GAP-like repeat-containing protein [Winogradskyella alexanderae]MCA0131216.1 FG-GAP-like repeat-containing protein [Winogradskyella alexanderae]
MKKITLFILTTVLSCFFGNAQYVFSPIEGPINVAQGAPVTYNLNDIANSAGVTIPASGTYNSFRVSVEWSEGSGIPWSIEADLTFITNSGSVNIDPPTSGGQSSTSNTTLTFEGDLPGLYDPASDGYIDLIFNQSYSGSNADWSNIVVTLYESPSCPNPTNLMAVNITDVSADLVWTEVGASTSWNIEWGLSGFSIGTGNTASNVTSTSYSLVGLTQGTSYDFYIQANCGNGEFSNFVGPVGFSTIIPARINFTQQSVTLNSGGFATAIVDMNGDNLDDIVGVQANNINIKQQNPDGTFTNLNITTPTADYTPSWSIAAADYDANGKTDLLYGAGSGVTFMRASNDGNSFTQQSTTEYVFSQRSNFVDINNDGFLDAFVCHDVQPNVYFINDGTGNLVYYQSDVTPGAPFELGNFASGGDYGSIWIDYNNDRNMDLFIAKCGGSEERRTNVMYTNNGDGTYTENAADIGLADPMQTWSSAWGDFDNDGDMDVFVGASSGSHKLMRNNGFSDDGDPSNDYTFTDVTLGAGVSSAPTGWESSAFDIDNDGNLDIIANGTLLFGKGDLTFEDADPNQINYKNGSFGDLNNDGFIDAYYNQLIYYNLGNSNNWVKINTNGMGHQTPNYSNINGIGARVEIITPSGTQIRDVKSGEGFEFMSTLTTHFGLGSDTTINEIRIYWPSGVIDVVPNPEINTTHNIVEGSFSLSIEDQSLSEFYIYPNPVKNILRIKTFEVLTERIATIFDVTGKRVFNQRINDNQLDVSNLQEGVYFLRIESNGRSIKLKFIKN